MVELKQIQVNDFLYNNIVYIYIIIIIKNNWFPKKER